ncbi:MAG: FAD:protein FMN transferase, partial [Chloroflexota bacterium]
MTREAIFWTTTKDMMKGTTTPTQRFSRREFLKISAVAGGLLAGGGLLARTGRRGPHTIKETRTLMGTVINLALVTMDPEEGQRLTGATFAEMERLIGMLDHRRPEATLARLNADGYLHNAPAALREVLEQALAYSELSGGAFDVSVLPMIKAYEQGQDVDAARRLTDYKGIRVQNQSIFLEREGMQLTLDG